MAITHTTRRRRSESRSESVRRFLALGGPGMLTSRRSQYTSNPGFEARK